MCNKLYNSHYVNNIDPNAAVFKYIPFYRFVEMFYNKKLTIRKVKFWEDPYELFFFKQNFEYEANGYPASLEKHKEMAFGQSWTLLEESDIMWRIYSPDKKSVRIKSTVQKLYELVEKGMNKSCKIHIPPYIGKVLYRTEKEINDWLSKHNKCWFTLTDTIVESLFIKRDTFSYEEEVRIIIIFETGSTYCGDDAIDIDIEYPHKFIDEICLDPRISKMDECLFNNILQDLLVPKFKIRKSNLYDFHPQKVIL